jgi:hypothetical protein
METTSFALGIVSAIVAALVVIIVYSFYKVQKLEKGMIAHQRYISDSLERGIIRELEELRELQKNEYTRMMSNLDNAVNAVYSHVDRQFDKRFDSFGKKLKVSCFEEDKKDDGKLYS